MGWLSWLLKKKRPEPVSKSQECIRMLELKALMEELFTAQRYVSKREYLNLTASYRETAEYFSVLQKSGMLESYCEKNAVSSPEVEEVLREYQNVEALIDLHNREYVNHTMESEKEYLDHILQKVDPQILLDEDQRRVVLTDEDYCLVIAGAGAGKTTTVAAKVKYLVEKKGIDPLQILVVSFTNKAVRELRDKINRDLEIACPIATFHSVGNAIIRKNSPEEKLNIVDDSRLYFVIRDYLRGSVMQNENTVNKLILFFAAYFDAPYEGEDLNLFFNQIAKANYSTLRSDLEDFKREVIDARTKKSVTIQNEILRSHQEVEIANFLYLNQIDYEYEPIYPYHILLARKPYTPDFVIKQGEKTAYIEHFGITENGENDRYGQDELETYKRAVNEKILLHRKHQTTLIYTFSRYNDRKPLLTHLQEQLEEKGFELKPRSNKEVMELLVAGEENRYIRKLIHLICRFISNFKVNGYTSEEFDRMYHSTQNVRTRLFLDICHECFLEYERYLKENKSVDFQDMINESARLLREVKEMKQKLDFKYVIVDEYQDISRQRFDLTKALSEVTEAKIIAVGDDWQSIYAFSGSDITLFTKFKETMGYAELLKIVNTYRNSQEVIDIAGNFIQKNPEQIKKTLKSPKTITDPVIIYTYDGRQKARDGERRSGVNYEIAHAVEVCLEEITEYARREGKQPGTILLLGRYGFDGDQLERSGLFEYVNYGGKIRSVRYPELNITFMTAHASKGLGYDNVILVNGKNETYGFPSRIEDDTVLSFVIRGDRSIDYAEERRLFYVAMTRTKNRVYMVAPEQNPSEFLLELKRDYKNVALRGNWNEEPPKLLGRKTCPICGYPMQLRYKKAYGLRLYLCTNEPEICGFMTNEYRADKMSIMKCDRCRDGYLIVKPGKDGSYFLGCTNYRKNGSGCNNVIWKKQYYEMMHLSESPEKQGEGQKEEDKKETDRAETEKMERNKTEAQVTPEQKQVQAWVDNRMRMEDYIKIEKSQLAPILYHETDLNEVVFTILSAQQNVSVVRYYGVTVLLDLLRGESTKKIMDMKLNEVPEYGALRKMNREDIQSIIEWLLANHFLLKTKGQYPVLHPTYDGLHYAETMTLPKLKKLQKYLKEEVILWDK